MTTIVLYQPEETFKLFSNCRGRSHDDCFDFFGVGSKTIAAENVSKVLNRRLHEHTIVAFERHSCFT